MKKTILMATVALFALTDTAMAQGAQSNQKPGDNAESGEIIVTAQRKSESVQKAAIAISALPGDALQKANISDPGDLGRLVPALQTVGGVSGIPQYYIRGVGGFGGNAFQEAAIAFNYDGVYLVRQASTSGLFYDLQRVEVLKGPQGTLYGRNATGGAINVLPNKPQLGETSGAISGQYGNYHTARLEGHINAPLSEKVAMRAAAMFIRHDGYMKDGTGDQNDLSFRFLVRAEPSDDLTIDMGFDYARQKSAGAGSTLLLPGGAANLSKRLGWNSPETIGTLVNLPNFVLARNSVPFVNDSFLNNKGWGVNANIVYDAGFGTFTVVPAYRSQDISLRDYQSSFRLSVKEKDTQTSIEARFATPEEGVLRGLIGGYYLNGNIDNPLLDVHFQHSYQNQFAIQKQNAAAVFGRITVVPTPDIHFTAAVRYNWERKEFVGKETGVLKICKNIPMGQFIPSCPNASFLPYDITPATYPAPNFNPFAPGANGAITVPILIDRTGANGQSATFRKTTFRFAADWSVTANNMLYASFERGFKAGGFFFTGDDGRFQPETIDAWTIGSKNTFFDRKLTLNIEGFYWKYKGQQISALSQDSFGTGLLATVNAGNSTLKGFEIEARANPIPGLSLTADIQYLDGKYTSFVYNKANLNNGISNGTGCPSIATTATKYTIDCSGKRPVNAPEWVANLGAQYDIELGGSGKLTPGISAHYQSKTMTVVDFLPDQEQAGYWTADASLTYSSPDKKWTVGLYGNNIFNKTVMAQAMHSPSSFYYSAILAPPSTYGVRASVNF